jgi:predicted PurR-regulated permease PerM
VWVLFDFLPALAWAGVLAIALWPVYQRLLRLMPPGSEHVGAPLVATLAIGIVFIAPVVLLGIALGHESHVVVAFVSEARNHGIAAPEWVERFPLIGPALAHWWNTNIGDPAMTEELIGRVDLKTLTGSLRQYGGEVVHRLAIFLFTLLTLFFFFRDGSELTDRLREISDRLIGQRGERVALHMIGAVHGTLNGLVLLGLAEGVLLGLSYLVAGLPYPATYGAVTAVAAVIPFAAPVVYALAALYLFTVGNTSGALIIAVFGSVVVFIADHFVRPFLIGGSSRLPFLLVLLGILGGLQTMGFLGLFLGPAMMAALVALWREWTDMRPPAAGIESPTFAAQQRTSFGGHGPHDEAVDSLRSTDFACPDIASAPARAERVGGHAEGS